VDVLSAIIGGAIAGVPQIINHLLGSRKDRLARQLAHYEVRLTAARQALGHFEDLASVSDYRNLDDHDAEELHDVIAEPFGEPLAKEATHSLFLDDKGESYQSCLARMKTHIVDLEKKVGLPPRLT
jgi:hypothetical protein